MTDFCRLAIGRGVNQLARREISLTPIVADSIRDAHRQGTRMDGPARVSLNGSSVFSKPMVFILKNYKIICYRKPLREQPELRLTRRSAFKGWTTGSQ